MTSTISPSGFGRRDSTFFFSRTSTVSPVAASRGVLGGDEDVVRAIGAGALPAGPDEAETGFGAAKDARHAIAAAARGRRPDQVIGPVAELAALDQLFDGPLQIARFVLAEISSCLAITRGLTGL